MKNFNIDEVSASLEQGVLLYGIRKFIIWFGFFWSFLLPLVTIVTISLGYMSLDADTIFAIIAVNCFNGGLHILYVYLIVKDKVLKNKVTQWIQDAVIVDATLCRIKEYRVLKNPYRIIVRFKFNGREYAFISEQGNCVTGFNNYYVKYCFKHNGQAKVLYSPTYNQVMLLKQ